MQLSGTRWCTSPCRPVLRCVRVRAVRNAKRLKYAGVGERLVKQPLFVSLESDGSDVWRLDPVIDLLDKGGVGIIPTDTLPAVVCDLENRDAVLKLYNVMELAPKKQLSVLVRNFRDISHYTAGFPAAVRPGQSDYFSRVKRVLPGPYTFILPASKNLPSQMIDVSKGRSKQRKTVGVRMSDNPVCKAVLEGLDRCLLSTSVHVPDQLSDSTEVPDTGTLWELYGSRGLDFIVDVGTHIATASTVIDLTTAEPTLVRQGKGDASDLLD